MWVWLVRFPCCTSVDSDIWQVTSVILNNSGLHLTNCNLHRVLFYRTLVVPTNFLHITLFVSVIPGLCSHKFCFGLGDMRLCCRSLKKLFQVAWCWRWSISKSYFEIRKLLKKSDFDNLKSDVKVDIIVCLHFCTLEFSWLYSCILEIQNWFIL